MQVLIPEINFKSCKRDFVSVIVRGLHLGRLSWIIQVGPVWCVIIRVLLRERWRDIWLQKWKRQRGDFLAVQWLRCRASIAGGASLNPGQGTKSPHATGRGQEDNVMIDMRLEWCGHKPRNARSHLKLEKTWNRFPLEPPRRTLPADIVMLAL